MSNIAKKVRKVSRKIKKTSNVKSTKAEVEMEEVEVPEMGELEVLYISPDVYNETTDTYIRAQTVEELPMQGDIEVNNDAQVVDYYMCPHIDCERKTKWPKGQNTTWSKKGMFWSPKAKIVKIHLSVSHDIPYWEQKKHWKFSPIPVYKQNPLQ